MADGPGRLVIMVDPPPDRRRLTEVLRWLRWLVPAAVLLVAPVPAADLCRGDDVVRLDCSDGIDGPLSIATALARRQV